jgi:hypothetical protein
VKSAIVETKRCRDGREGHKRLCGFVFQKCWKAMRNLDFSIPEAKKERVERRENEKLQQMDYKERLLSVIMIIPFNHFFLK